MLHARSLLIRQVQCFFEEKLCGLYRWQTSGNPDDELTPGVVRIRPPEKYPKEKGRRQLDKEVVAVDFGPYSLLVASPEEKPPVGNIIIFHQTLGSLEGPLDAATWARVEAFIKKGETHGNRD